MKLEADNLDRILSCAMPGAPEDCDSGKGDRIHLKRPFHLDPDDSDLFSSRTTDRMHFPLFDFDFPVAVIPSRTDGHFHVILQKKVTETQYRIILDAFVEAGLCQRPWADRLDTYGAIFLRLPAFFKNLVNRAKVIYADKPNEVHNGLPG